MCLERLNLPKDAKHFYEQAIKKYPNTPPGKEAKRLLRKLGR